MVEHLKEGKKVVAHFEGMNCWYRFLVEVCLLHVNV